MAKAALKADIHSANFSRANDKFPGRILVFQFPNEENEIWINCKTPIVRLLKTISFSNHNKMRSDMKHGIRLFHDFILSFCFT